jgi:hypothetical protein
MMQIRWIQGVLTHASQGLKNEADRKNIGLGGDQNVKVLVKHPKIPLNKVDR